MTTLQKAQAKIKSIPKGQGSPLNAEFEYIDDVLWCIDEDSQSTLFSIAARKWIEPVDNKALETRIHTEWRYWCESTPNATSELQIVPS